MELVYFKFSGAAGGSLHFFIYIFTRLFASLTVLFCLFFSSLRIHITMFAFG